MSMNRCSSRRGWTVRPCRDSSDRDRRHRLHGHLSEGHSAVVGLLPSREELAELQKRIGGLTIDPGGDRRINIWTLTIAASAWEVTKVPLHSALSPLSNEVPDTDTASIRRGRGRVCILVRWCRPLSGIYAPL